MKYKITKHLKGTPIDWNIVTVEKPLFDFYVSLINPADSMYQGRVSTGRGSCKNIAYQTTFRILKEDGSLGSGSVNIVSKKTNATAANVSSGSTVYLFDGNYQAKATIDGTAVTKSFTVSGETQTVDLSKSSQDGSITGSVKNASDQTGIEGAKVEVFQIGVSCGQAATAADGSYTISLPEGFYRYVITADGFVSSSGYFSIGDGETKYMETALMAEEDQDAIMGGIYGTIKDARTGYPLSDVTVRIYKGINNTTSTNAATDLPLTTNSNGEYKYKSWSLFGVKFGLPAYNYTVELSKEGYITTSFNVVVVGGEDIQYNGTIAPESMDNEYRVVLTWGEFPYDLDSHYRADLANGGADHVYYSHLNGDSASLDTDDTTSYGPETVYISGFDSLTNGFHYYVHDFSNCDKTSSTALGNSNAAVQLYKGADLIATYYVPAGSSGTVWDVFSVDKNGRVTPVNTMSYQSDASLVGSK